MNSDKQPHIRFQNVSRHYRVGFETVIGLAEVNLEIFPRDFVTVMGPSGGGKTTFLNILGALDRPDKGDVYWGHHRISKMNDAELTSLRREKIGFVFQFFNLMPTMTVLENVKLPLLLNRSQDNDEKQVHDLISYVGLEKRINSFPAELSGGEMQRVAIARALVHQPSLILADEPTGNLDSENGTRILNLLNEVSSNFEATLVVATHNPAAAEYGNRHFHISDGKVTSETKKQSN